MGRILEVTPTWLVDPAAPLLALGTALGVGRATWVDREHAERLSFARADLPVASTVDLRAEHLRALAQTYGSALTCRFRMGDLPVLEAAADLDDAAITAFRSEIAESPSVAFDMVLNKKELLEQSYGQFSGSRVILYLFPEAFERALVGTLDEIEKLLWPDDSTKAVVLVPSREIRLDGPLMAVVGGTAITGWQGMARADVTGAERARQMHAACRETLKWQDDWLQRLTPIHLNLDGRASIGDIILDALLIHQADAAILYTADRTRVRNGNWQATYAEPSQSVDVLLGNVTRPLDGDLRSGATELGRLAEWVYEPAWYVNRLAMVQVGVTQILRLAEANHRYTSLLRSAPSIFSDVQWHWKSFVSGKIDAYSAEVRDLEDSVVSVTDGYADQASKIIDRLSGTMLSAIAVLLGSIVAALFRDEFDATIFRLGTLAYAFYVLLFPLIIGSLYEWRRLQDVSDGFELRRTRFEERLPKERVEGIVGQRVAASKRVLSGWFAWTRAIYVAVVVLALIAAAYGPGWVAADRGAAGALTGAPNPIIATPTGLSIGTAVSGTPIGP
jgi:hypothetical protein